jgi:NAD(P)H-quinone oxidoreductase subunit 5
MSMWLSSILLVCIPLSLATAAWWFGRTQTKNAGKSLLHVALAMLVLFVGALVIKGLSPQPLAEPGYISHANLNMLMLGLVLFMAVILIAFSRNYMAGQARINLYWRWLLNTLAAVSLVVISNHLLLFWLGWLGISLALHQLLTYYPERPRAALAAHKKFLLARIAETSLLIAIVLLYQQHHTFFISDLVTHFNQVALSEQWQLSLTEQIAAVLIALTALIKCAQLPVHGWLIQVVEAPTPVSALLHAGVINLGGFLLILFAPLFMQVPAAQWLVLIVAGLTTVICALVMSTRISIKVRLAWSTSAQMGLMLVECALGLFELALLHLIAHSAYKAHAFLNSGNAVYEHLQRRLAPAIPPSLIDWLVGFGLAAFPVVGILVWLDYQGPWSMWLLLIIALSMLIAQRHGGSIRASILPFSVLLLVLLLAYGAMKSILSGLLPNGSYLAVAQFSPADVWIMLLFVALFYLSWLLRFQSERPAIQRLSVILFAGLYLDEWLTRLTLKIWPVRLPIRANAKVMELPSSTSAKEF